MIASTRSSCSRATSSSPCFASSCWRRARSSPRSSVPDAGARSESAVVPPAHPPTVLTSRAASTIIPPRSIKRFVLVCILPLSSSTSQRESTCDSCIKRPSTIDRGLFLLEELHIRNHHRGVDGLHHVVHGQQCDRHRRERLHFDAGPAHRSHRRPDTHTGQGLGQACLDLDMIEA